MAGARGASKLSVLDGGNKRDISMLKIFLLGTPRFERDGRPVHVGRRKSVALAAYLACTGSPVSRETLAALLWPEHDQTAALKGVRRELARLKQALGAESVRATRSHLALEAHDAIAVDVLTLRQRLALLQAHNHFPEVGCKLCLDAATAAVSERAPFMAGFNLPGCPEFDTWQDFQRESVRQGIGRTLQRLVSWHGGQQEYDRALRYGRHWLALDPLHEAARRGLMEVYVSAGQQAAALQIYDEGVALLHEELAVAPDPETTRLGELIRAGRFAEVGEPAAAPAERRAQRRPQNNLPWPSTPFVGRDHELTMIQLRLRESACRLLTLVGPTGIGKTRMALEVGHLLVDQGSPGFVDGVVFVPLVDSDGPEAMIRAVMAAADLAIDDRMPPEPQLLAALQEQQMLLILDNLEHLPAAGKIISTILAQAPRVKIVATSCRALRLREEWFHPLYGLSVPPAGSDEVEDAITYDAVRLFEERARQALPTFSLAEDVAAVIRICRLVEGMPLALELAAGWIDVLDAATIADELEQGPDLFEARACNVPPRQQSIRASFHQTWSWLDGSEQEAVTRLARLEESFTREEADRVGAADLFVLSKLMEKSLLQPVGSQRYRLPQLLRHFACRELEAQL